MAYRYFTLLGDGKDLQRCPIPMDWLKRNGLQKRFDASGIRLFASEDTPVLATPCGGALVGQIFHRDGTVIDDSAQLPQMSEPATFLAALTRHYWGDYVLLQSKARPDSPEFVISRDPSGGVMCLHAANPQIRFATSDIDFAVGLGLCERSVDWEFVAQFLAYPFVKTECTGLRGVRELLPGGSLHLRPEGPTISQIWSPWDFVSIRNGRHTFGDAAASVRSAIELAVRSWSQVDRSILLELSGGLDSSILAACLGKCASRAVCATLVPTMPGADERQYASAIAERAGLPLIAEMLAVERGRIDARLPPASITPRAGPLQLAVDEIMQEVAQEEGLESFWSGGGGDTVFSYLTSAAPAADAFIKGHPLSGLKAISDIANLHQCTLWKAARLTLKKLNSPHPKPYASDHSFLASPFAVDVPDPHPWMHSAPGHAPGDIERVQGLAGTQVARDGLPRGVIHRLRLPLLSQPVMEACLAVPSWLWVSGGINRSVARAAFSDALPKNVLNRRSKGDFIQYCAAIYRHNKERIRTLLLDGELASRGLLNIDDLSKFFDRPLAAREQTFMRVFDLCTLESWIRQQP